MKPKFMPLVFVLASLAGAQAQEVQFAPDRSTPQAPPPAPPIVYRTFIESLSAAQPQGLILYSIGQPTDEEQLYLEYVNRMRANPSGEGQLLATTTDPDVVSAYSYFGVDLNLMRSQFNTNPPAPPLAMNAQLIASARWHSGDMFTNQYQGHYQTNGTVVMAPWDRMLAMGYNYSSAGENVYSYAKSVFHGHAGFAVDWGYGTGGMQTPPGHRISMFNANFREVGMGIVNGVNGPVGPQLITQNFGTASSSKPLLSGVVYFDFNGNNFYDLGEGIGGVTVSVPGSSYYAVTADSGGYTVPLSTNGNYAVTFSANQISNQQVATVTSSKNVKLDCTIPYSPPVLVGPNPAYANQGNTYTFSAVAAATGYQWRQTQLAAYSATEGAENGFANVTVVSSAGYSVLASDVKASGSYSFHFAQPDGADQFLTLTPVLRPTSTSQLTFSKRLGYATSVQIAKAQVSTDSGATWQDVWTQAGSSSGSGESGFSTQIVALGSYAGNNILIRFAYILDQGSYHYQTDAGVGLYIDNIAVSSASQVLSPVVSNVSPGTGFVFTPTNTGSYLLEVRSIINSRTLNWGPTVSVTVTTPPPAIVLASHPTYAGNQIQLEFNVTNYRSGMTFQLWKTSDLGALWTQDSSATLQTVTPSQKFRFTTSTASGQSYYRVRGL